MSKLITIATFTEVVTANLVKSKLEASGIPCFLMDENTISLLPIYSFALGNIKLKIHESDVEKAELVLKKSEPIFADDFNLKQEHKSDSSTCCPNCHSDNTYKEEFSKTSILGYLLLMFPIPIFSNTRRCFDCGYEWKMKK